VIVRILLPAKRQRGLTLRRAFTLLEVLVVIGILGVFVVMLIPQRSHRVRPWRIMCVNNLKQVSQAFAVWSGDHNDRFPMEVSVTNGGTMEWIPGPNAFRHLAVLSNELGTPKILICPAEVDRKSGEATTFEIPAHDPGQFSFSGNTNLSYFVAVDATTNGNPRTLLVGDHNLTNGLPVIAGMLNVPTNRPAGWTDQMHRKQGNIALSDFSVPSLNDRDTRDLLLQTGRATNRLAMP
jgi:prepilin-type N-terminal cleavage/methylation domain-containing protein